MTTDPCILVPLADLVELAKLGREMRDAQIAFFRSGEDLVMWARARQLQARFDQAVKAALAREGGAT